MECSVIYLPFHMKWSVNYCLKLWKIRRDWYQLCFSDGEWHPNVLQRLLLFIEQERIINKSTIAYIRNETEDAVDIDVVVEPLHCVPYLLDNIGCHLLLQIRLEMLNENRDWYVRMTFEIDRARLLVAPSTFITPQPGCLIGYTVRATTLLKISLSLRSPITSADGTGQFGRSLEEVYPSWLFENGKGLFRNMNSYGEKMIKFFVHARYNRIAF